MKKKIFFSISVLVLAACLMISLNVSAGTITGGVSDAGLTDRWSRDGASAINFIDLSSTISGNGWITSFSIYAQSHAEGWENNTDARQVSLIIFRNDGNYYDVVGTSPLETVPANGWDQKYTFDLSNPIPVQTGDYIGWYYPLQGSQSDNLIQAES